MAATLEISCPSCGKDFKVPTEFVGRLIKCKNCQTPFEVTAPGKPKAAKPVAAKPVAKPAENSGAKPAAPAAAAAGSMPIPFKEDEDEVVAHGKAANPYGVQHDPMDVPRCPFCAKELDPPDTKICLNCGYDLLERKRHESKATYELTTGDYIMHWLPAIACILVVFILVTVSVVGGLNMRSWLTGSFLDSDEKNEITGKTKFYVHPLCFNIWLWTICAWLIWKCGKFAFRRLVLNWRPTEVVKKKD